MREPPSIAELNTIRLRFMPESEVVRAYMARIPPAWELIEKSADGAAFRRGSLQVLVSLSKYASGQIWIHVSVTGRTGQARFHLPTWEELKRVKHDFIGDRWAYQVFPPESEYINQCETCLHLFSQYSGEPALPDFTRGMGTL